MVPSGFRSSTRANNRRFYENVKFILLIIFSLYGLIQNIQIILSSIGVWSAYVVFHSPRNASNAVDNLRRSSLFDTQVILRLVTPQETQFLYHTLDTISLLDDTLSEPSTLTGRNTSATNHSSRIVCIEINHFASHLGLHTINGYRNGFIRNMEQPGRGATNFNRCTVHNRCSVPPARSRPGESQQAEQPRLSHVYNHEQLNHPGRLGHKGRLTTLGRSLRLESTGRTRHTSFQGGKCIEPQPSCSGVNSQHTEQQDRNEHHYDQRSGQAARCRYYLRRSYEQRHNLGFNGNHPLFQLRYPTLHRRVEHQPVFRTANGTEIVRPHPIRFTNRSDQFTEQSAHTGACRNDGYLSRFRGYDNQHMDLPGPSGIHNHQLMMTPSSPDLDNGTEALQLEQIGNNKQTEHSGVARMVNGNAEGLSSNPDPIISSSQAVMPAVLIMQEENNICLYVNNIPGNNSYAILYVATSLFRRCAGLQQIHVIPRSRGTAIIVFSTSSLTRAAMSAQNGHRFPDNLRLQIRLVAIGILAHINDPEFNPMYFLV